MPDDALIMAQALAECAAQTMYATGAASRSLGIRIVGVTPGHAIVKMPVRPDMLDGQDVCHGGIIFALADSAFAFASNSYNIKAVTSSATIDFLTSAKAGEMLTAIAMERVRHGRTALYDVSVIKSDGTLVALYRGKAHQIKGEIVPINIK